MTDLATALVQARENGADLGCLADQLGIPWRTIDGIINGHEPVAWIRRSLTAALEDDDRMRQLRRRSRNRNRSTSHTNRATGDNQEAGVA